MSETGFAIKDTSELDRDYGKWILVRRSLGVNAFGINMVELGPGEDVPEHTELERDQEEVFYVVSGSPTLVLDGVKHPTGAGTFARIDPAISRTVINHGDQPAVVMIVSAPCTSGFTPMSWS